MPEAGDYFAWLGLTPGVYSERELADRLDELRALGSDADRLAEATAAYNVLRDPGRQSRRLQMQADPLTDAPAPPGPEIESAYAAAVASLLEADTGVLRYSNRRRLLDLAARMGIAAFEANLLIERTRFRATLTPAWLSPAEEPAEPAAAPQAVRPARRRRWILAIALAILLDAVVLMLLLV